MTRQRLWNWSKVAAIAAVLTFVLTVAVGAASGVFRLGADRQAIGSDIAGLRHDVDCHEDRIQKLEDMRHDVSWIRSRWEQWEAPP